MPLDAGPEAEEAHVVKLAKGTAKESRWKWAS